MFMSIKSWSRTVSLSLSSSKEMCIDCFLEESDLFIELCFFWDLGLDEFEILSTDCCFGDLALCFLLSCTSFYLFFVRSVISSEFMYLLVFLD